jgi:dihydrofolate reductase
VSERWCCTWGVGKVPYGRSVQREGGSISLRLAMSLDGYIADENGDYDWIVPVPSPSLDTVHQLPFEEFLGDVDVVVMGRRCYDQGHHRDYAGLGKKVVVATSRPPAPENIDGSVEFVAHDVVGVVKAAREHGQHCFLFGGGILIESFLAAGAVDTITVGIVPVLLGKGRKLFPGGHPRLDLTLADYALQDGKVRLVYERR